MKIAEIFCMSVMKAIRTTGEVHFKSLTMMAIHHHHHCPCVPKWGIGPHEGDYSQNSLWTRSKRKTMILHLALGTYTTHPKIMFCKVKQEPDFTVSMRQDHALQCNNIWMLQLSQKLQWNKDSTKSN